MKIERILGFIILLAGIVVISFTLYASFNIFMANTMPPEIFKASEKTDISGGGIEEIIQDQFSKLLPAKTIPTLLNLLAWSTFAGLVIFAGAQISFIGIRLLKEK